LLSLLSFYDTYSWSIRGEVALNFCQSGSSPTFEFVRLSKPNQATSSENRMAPSNKNISHGEIWDDSALVDSWNDALEEYKKYHSMKARGENVEEVVRAAESHENGVGQEIDHEGGRGDVGLVNDPRAKENWPEETGDHATQSAKDAAPVVDQQPKSSQASERTPPALPQQMIGQVRDEGLKNLLMSWYYAGYYTGLYEGQQQGAATDAKLEA